ncbi:hypothetical protein H4R19_003741 [Coemansia spiralis]|nr:hypothetical protein H4R19_003741 [Coemansia spiralis]
MPPFGRLCGTAGAFLVRSQRRRFASQQARDAPPEGRLEDIGMFRAYGKPVATLFLWSTLAYLSLQAVWSKLYFDEVRLETEARIDELQDELRELNRNTPR